MYAYVQTLYFEVFLLICTSINSFIIKKIRRQPVSGIGILKVLLFFEYLAAEVKIINY